MVSNISYDEWLYVVLMFWLILYYVKILYIIHHKGGSDYQSVLFNFVQYKAPQPQYMGYAALIQLTTMVEVKPANKKINYAKIHWSIVW